MMLDNDEVSATSKLSVFSGSLLTRQKTQRWDKFNGLCYVITAAIFNSLLNGNEFIENFQKRGDEYSIYYILNRKCLTRTLDELFELNPIQSSTGREGIQKRVEDPRTIIPGLTVLRTGGKGKKNCGLFFIVNSLSEKEKKNNVLTAFQNPS